MFHNKIRLNSLCLVAIIKLTDTGGLFMRTICDYMIIQRDADGFGRALFTGKINPEKGNLIVARVMSEDSNIMVVPWIKCDVEGDTFSVRLTIPQGGLYRVEARQTVGEFNPKTNRYDWAEYISYAHHIGVGEIFVMAGQSNMSGYGKDPAYDPPELGIHLFDNSGRWGIAAHPLCTSINPVYPNNDGSAGNSPGLSFARAMRKALGVPIGLVSACLGGSSLESWNPSEENPFLYRSMTDKISEIGNFKGMIWYQGCNETNEEECGTYYEKFAESVNLWREKYGDFPIVTCQLNRHASRAENNSKCWGMVRDAQRRAALTLKDVYIVTTSDLPVCDGIHNTSGACIIIGERIAGTLLKSFYNLPGYSAPIIKSARKIENDKILVAVDGGQVLKTMDDNPYGMNIQDEKGIMNCTVVVCCDDGLIVTGEREICGEAYFHAYWKKELPAFTVRDVYGMPLTSCYMLKID